MTVLTLHNPQLCPFPLKTAVKNITKEKLPKHWFLYFTIECCAEQEYIRGERNMTENDNCSLQKILLIFIVIFFCVSEDMEQRPQEINSSLENQNL